MGERQTRRVLSVASPTAGPTANKNSNSRRAGFMGSTKRMGPHRMRSSVSAPELHPSPRFLPSGDDIEGGEGDSSVLSDFDMLNDAIQEYLLDSDNDDNDDDDDDDIIDAAIFHGVRPFFNSSRRAEVGRRQQARKSGSSPAVHARFACAGAVVVVPGLTLAEMMLPRQRQHQRRVALLPCDRGLPDAPLCVVMDLDETLVTARRECVYPRPHVRELLDTCHAEGCEVVVWSAGSPLHVNNVIRVIAEVAQRRDWYHHIISRHRRWYRDDNEMVKDLSALGRPLNRVLLLENSPQLILQQPGHVVLVEDYVRPTVHDDSLRIFAGVVRRVAAGMRGASDEATPDVPRLLAADAALINLSFPSSHPSAAEGVLCCRGITYSPQNVFALRSYGGMHPLPAEKMRDA